MRKFIIILLISTLCIGGCSKFKKVEISNISVKDLSIDLPKGTVLFTLYTELDNPNRRKFKIANAAGEIYQQGIHFASISTTEQYTIEKGANAIPIKLQLKITDPLSLISVGFNFKNLQKMNLTVNFEATISSGPIKRTLKYSNIPLDKIGDAIEQLIQ